VLSRKDDNGLRECIDCAAASTAAVTEAVMYLRFIPCPLLSAVLCAAATDYNDMYSSFFDLCHAMLCCAVLPPVQLLPLTGWSAASWATCWPGRVCSSTWRRGQQPLRCVWLGAWGPGGGGV
jgi:hypothetical protein